MSNIINKIFNRIIGTIVVLAVMVSLTGCSETELASHLLKQTMGGNSKSIGHFKVGSPYKIKGRKYYPKETYNHTEVGMASWYGPGFHGKMTANGEIFNQGDLTAAHRTLQLPSIIRVTNLRNGRSVIVRVNDRGPFAHERVLDLSEKAATVLGYKKQGITKIKIELLGNESLMVAQAAKQGRDTRGVEVALNRNGAMPSQKPVASRSVSVGGYYVQAGAFSQPENAKRFSQLLSGISKSDVVKFSSPQGPLYKVRLGPVTNLSQANQLLAAVESRSNSNAIIIKE